MYRDKSGKIKEKSFDMSQRSGGKTEKILAYVKESGEAYGWGTNEDWSMSDAYKQNTFL